MVGLCQNCLAPGEVWQGGQNNAQMDPSLVDNGFRTTSVCYGALSSRYHQAFVLGFGRPSVRWRVALLRAGLLFRRRSGSMTIILALFMFIAS